jgi:DNA-damage-inducible protein J
MKTAMIRARIEPRLKNKVEKLFAKLGLNTTEAITLFYKQVELCQGLPFEIRIPNATTIKTFQDTDAGQDLVGFDNADELIKDLNL